MFLIKSFKLFYNFEKTNSMKKNLLALILIFSITSLNLNSQCGISYTLGSAINMFTMIKNCTNPVAVDKNLNTVLFIHRHNSNAFGGNNGNFRYDISGNGGTSWTNNIGVLNPLSTNLARYPNAVIYNPSNNNSTFPCSNNNQRFL